MSRNLKLTLAYDGSDFSGWQVQPTASTIQGTLASAIGRITGENVLPQGSGRTDAGVHALAQVATFSTSSPIPAENFVKAIMTCCRLPSAFSRSLKSPLTFMPGNRQKPRLRYRIYRGTSLLALLVPIRVALSLSARRRFHGRGRAVNRRRARFTSFCRRRSGGVAVKTENLPTCGHCSSKFGREGDELIYTVRGNGFPDITWCANLLGSFHADWKRHRCNSTTSSPNSRSTKIVRRGRDRSSQRPVSAWQSNTEDPSSRRGGHGWRA